MNIASLYRMPVLTYHSVSSAGERCAIDCGAFVDQMEWLANHGWTGVSAQRSARQPLAKRTVVLTFDDGYADFAETVAPILARFSFAATVFVMPGLIDGGKRYLSHRLMDWDALRDISTGGIEIGSHTCSHFLLLDAGAEAAKELSASKCRIEEKLGQRVSSFAYPKGLYVDGVKQLVAAAGYERAYTLYGRARDNSDLLTLRRIGVTRNDTLPRFAAKMHWAYRLLVDLGLKASCAGAGARAGSDVALETEAEA
jgi:peptidoglycan/xylan/chitin deacetylase (PgdA/CDA1 family)